MIRTLNLIKTPTLRSTIREMSSKSKNSKLDEFGRPYPQKQDGYYVVSLTVDAGVSRLNSQGNREVLLIKRKKDPFQGKLAFPGGFVEYNEDPLKAVTRELKEETNLSGSNPRLINAYGDPQRDPRKHIVSLFYHVDVSNFNELKAGDDAADAQFYEVEKIQDQDLAFDHPKLMKDFLSKL